MSERTPAHCLWCGREIESPGRGRPRRYCGQSCRQRAYEARRGGRGAGPVDAVALSRATVDRLHDGLYELRCAVEDIATAAEEGAGHGQIAALAADALDLARELDKLR